MVSVWGQGAENRYGSLLKDGVRRTHPVRLLVGRLRLVSEDELQAHFGKFGRVVVPASMRAVGGEVIEGKLRVERPPRDAHATLAASLVGDSGRAVRSAA